MNQRQIKKMYRTREIYREDYSIKKNKNFKIILVDLFDETFTEEKFLGRSLFTKKTSEKCVCDFCGKEAEKITTELPRIIYTGVVRKNKMYKASRKIRINIEKELNDIQIYSSVICLDENCESRKPYVFPHLGEKSNFKSVPVFKALKKLGAVRRSVSITYFSKKGR